MNDLAEIHRALGRIEGQNEAIIERLDACSEKMEKQEGRISKLENRQHWYSGFAAAIGTLLGISTSHFGKL